MNKNKFDPSIIAVVGEKRSGKTTTVEVLVKELSSRGYKVAAVKHVSEQNLEVDTKGKDTWRYAQAGASVIVGVATKEIVTIEKINTREVSFKRILEGTSECDVIILEGFKELVRSKKDLAKIVAVKSDEEALQAKKKFCPIVAFTGPNSTEPLCLKIPYVDVWSNPSELADLVESTIKGAKAKH